MAKGNRIWKVKEKSTKNLKSGNAHHILRFFLRLFSGLSSDLDATYNVAVSVCMKKRNRLRHSQVDCVKIDEQSSIKYSWI